MDPIRFYRTRLEETDLDLEGLKRKIAANSILRLVSFAAVFASLFGLLKLSMPIAIIGAVFFMAVFLVLVKRHIELQKKRRYAQERKKILTTEINACNHDFRDIPDGKQHINNRHSYSFDLDVFGKGSLFCMINRTVTSSGERRLASLVTMEQTDKLSILSRQEAIKELTQKQDFSLHFRTTGKVSDIEQEDRANISKWVKMKSFLSGSKVFTVALYMLPVVSLLLFVLMLINSTYSGFFIISFLVNLGFVSNNLKKINHEHNQVSNLLKLLQKYGSLIRIVEKEDFKSTALKESMERLKYHNFTAGESIQKLTKLVSAFDNRLNFVVAIFLEGLLLWDYHCLKEINNWKKEHGSRLDQWFEEIAYIDSLISLSGFAFNSPDFVYPEISDETIFEAKDLGHPSIPGTVRICNDFKINSQGEFVIITGANMAGKSTFLRTVGVNIVLARTGAPVCASSFSFKPMKMFTSMRTSDSLAENESYFYAELRRLQEMLHKLEAEGDVFIILDEILKGTNSVDKQKGSFAALEKILKLNGTGIIATHDLALTEISSKYPEHVHNKCFEIEIDNASISFDYKLYNGVTQKMNAMLLMEQMGII